MKTHIHAVITGALLLTAVLLTGCTTSMNEKWTNTVSSPRITFEYPGSTILDESQVATIYPVFNLSITNVSQNGQSLSFGRVDGASRMLAGWRPIDLLPGVYEITGSYNESSGGNAAYSFSTDSITIKLTVEAGHYYRINYSKGGRSWNMFVEENVPDATKKNINGMRTKLIAAQQKDS